MTFQTFSVVGITDYNDKYKVRFTNDMCRRLKRCSKNGATRLDFIDLPAPMTKVDALKYMLAHPDFQSPEDQTTIADALVSRDKNTLSDNKVKAKRGRPRRITTSVRDVLDAIQ